jgi:hypothetical protein
MRKSARDGCVMGVRRGSCARCFGRIHVWTRHGDDDGALLSRGRLQILAPGLAADAENLNLVLLGGCIILYV